MDVEPMYVLNHSLTAIHFLRLEPYVVPFLIKNKEQQ